MEYTADIANHVGEEMYRWAKDLFPICRSITGNGVRQTLKYFEELLPGLRRYEVATGEKFFDWQVPNEWNVNEAFVENQRGDRILDFATNNLHLVGYSEPIDQWVELEELQRHLYSLPDQEELISYVTSYYSRTWGFCLKHNQRVALKPGKYRVKIDSTLIPGHLTYGELLLPGETSDEIFLSTNICHPSMANNELSGPVVTAALVRWLTMQETRRYSYRIVFVPETIGAIVYTCRNFEQLTTRVKAGFVLTCVGDNRSYSFVPSRNGETLADRVALHCLKHHAPNYIRYSFLERGSDERQYCAPHVDLPVASVMRTKYGKFSEYHTSGDDLTLISPQGLQGSFDLYRKMLTTIENNNKFSIDVKCEPQLGRRGLYPSISMKDSGKTARDLLNIIAYCDGKRDLIGIAEVTGLPSLTVLALLSSLIERGLIERT